MVLLASVVFVSHAWPADGKLTVSSAESLMISCMHEYMSVSLDSDLIPREIDDHLIRFRKAAGDVDYNLYGYCSICNSRVDEFDYCACGEAAD